MNKNPLSDGAVTLVTKSRESMPLFDHIARLLWQLSDEDLQRLVRIIRSMQKSRLRRISEVSVIKKKEV